MLQKEFGDYLKELRQAKGKTLNDLAKALNVSLSLLCDIEKKRRSLDEDKIEILANFLHLTKEEKNKLYDLDAQRRQSVPKDVKEVIMYSDASAFVRLALRKTKDGQIPKDAWEEFAKNNNYEDGDDDKNT